MTLYVVILAAVAAGQAFGPFDDIEAAGAFAQTVASVEDPQVVEVEDPATYAEVAP